MSVLVVLIVIQACDTPPHAPGLLLEPLPGRFLDHAPGLGLVTDPDIPGDSIAHDGLIPPLALDPETGWPRSGPSEDAALRESEATYARLESAGRYAPETLERWKERFGFPPRADGETLEAWRQRAGVYVYYNINELGLGRELGCSEFSDRDARGEPATGLACFVGNYGATFDDRADSLADAVAGTPVRNTVCIAFIPSLPERARVQFFVYGKDGERQTWAQLDQLGPRPHPFVCTNCHGGEHHAGEHLTFDARFLPTQPAHLRFGSTAPYDRASQEEAIRRVNALALGEDGSDDQKLTPQQRTWLAALYEHDGGTIRTPGQVMSPSWAPPEWSRASDAAVFERVVDPYCMTCHAAFSGPASELLATPEMMRAWVRTRVCDDFSMPNAQQTGHRFWGGAGPVIIDGFWRATPADALLAWAGIDRAGCRGLADVSGCVRDGEPAHALCGNDHSGTVCLPDGRCGPDLQAEPSSGYLGPIGYCQLDGPRRCPSGQECVTLAGESEDWRDGGCFACGRGGHPTCL